MNGIVFPAVVLLTAMFSSSASRQPSPNQPDMTVDASVVGNTITLLAKGLRSAYVFPDVGEKVAAMLEQRQARGEYAAVSSAKALSELVTRQMFELTRDKHLRLLYSSQVVPQFSLSRQRLSRRQAPECWNSCGPATTNSKRWSGSPATSGT
jgi:peptidase S41-like protein